MALERVRFLHSSDWRLEEPLGGVRYIPAPLHDEFLQAPFRAAERVIDLAIRERVDFLILTGDLLRHETASPYALEFLLQQFERLREQQIVVYWLGGKRDDPDLWPAQLDLPSNVRTFAPHQIDEFVHERDGVPIAVVVGRSFRPDVPFRAAEYGGGGTTPRVALVYGTPAAESLDAPGVNYWALGGRPSFQRLLDGSATACYAGSPQGRTPQQTQRHGPLLVELKFGEAELRQLSSEVWSWRQERLELPDGADLADLERLLRENARQVSPDESAQGCLIAWSIAGNERIARELRDLLVQQRLLESLEKHTSEARWTIELVTEPPEIPAELWEEDSICGDFLRAVRELQRAPDGWRKLESFFPPEPMRDLLEEQLEHGSPEQQQELWRQVAAWGIDLLRGEEPLASASSGE